MDALIGGANIQGEFRYHLWRARSGGDRSLCFVMLNPSTADGETDDPTIRKCLGFAERLGFRSIDVLNLYAYRSSSPADLRAAGFPVGEYNDGTIRGVLGEYVERVIVAWGTLAQPTRAREVIDLIRSGGYKPEALAVTKDGHPAHPLYLPYTCKPKPFG